MILIRCVMCDIANVTKKLRRVELFVSRRKLAGFVMRYGVRKAGWIIACTLTIRARVRTPRKPNLA